MNFLSRLLLIVLSLLLISCDQENTDATVESQNILIMGTSADYPPFTFIENGEFKGLEIDLARLIAEKLGRKLEIRDMDFASLIPALQAGKLHLSLSGLTVTPERLKILDFSIQYFVPVYALVHKINDPITSKQEFNARNIGVQLGSTMEKFLQDMQLGGAKFKLVSMLNNLNLIQDLLVGRLDGVMAEEAQAKIFVRNNPTILTYSTFDNPGQGYAVLLPKDSPLTIKINHILQELQNDGELDTLKSKWAQK